MPIGPDDFDCNEHSRSPKARNSGYQNRYDGQEKQYKAGSNTGNEVASIRRMDSRYGVGLGIFEQPQELMAAGERQESQEVIMARMKQEQKRQWFTASTQQGPVVEANSLAPAMQSRSLLPAAVVGADFRLGRRMPSPDPNLLAMAAAIERPRSALHAGDFRQRQGSDTTPSTPRPASRSPPHHWISTSPVPPWIAPPTRNVKNVTRVQMQLPQQHQPRGLDIPNRHRAASYSALSSSYVHRTPTSPLVLQSNSRDLDGPDEPTDGRPFSPDKAYRRRTYSPNSTSSFSPVKRAQFPEYSPPQLHHERSEPSRQHENRRSFTYMSDAQSFREFFTPSARPRQPSVSDGSPLQRAPLVGRYEESILRGRMSTTPSKPLDFVAQIGVLGKGSCKSSLRCPSHVIVPFPAVFYDYKHAQDRTSTLVDGPSPYVGQIDLENNIKPAAGANRVKREHSPGSEVEVNPEDMVLDGHGPLLRNHRRRHPRKPPKGCYRIPQQGQLQIIIKNPHKTAVKLFLVPYDLTGMEPGQKTFIRQRSYSWGPIIDMPLDARKNLGTSRPEAALSTGDDLNSRPVLRYLIHLHICCPSRGRYYLHKTIRVVFANRVPDGKEKLRVETQLPEPRFSSYKPEVSDTPKRGKPPPPPLFTPQPVHPVSRAASAGEFTQHLENKYTLPWPQPTNHLHRNSGVAFQRTLPQFDFSRIPSPQPPSNGDHPMSDDQDILRSPKAPAFGNAEGMSWTAHSTLQDRLSPISSHSDGSGQNVFGSGRSGSDRSRSSTPRPGQGLLARQFRDLAEQTKAQKPA